MRPVITTNPHDGGYDLVAGHDVTGPVIGSVSVDSGGLVFTLKAVYDCYPVDSVGELDGLLLEEGWALTLDSRVDIGDLEP